jgi:hypothetical protein
VRPTLECHENRTRRASFESYDHLKEPEISVDMPDTAKSRSGIEKALEGLVWWCLDPNGVAILFRDERMCRRRRRCKRGSELARSWNEAFW